MVSKWMIKAVVQKAISFLPWSGRINYFFQKHITRGVHLTDEHFSLKLQHAREHHQAYLTYATEDSRGTILELGTGWYPVIPLLFHLTGAAKVVSVDIQRWMTRETQQVTLLKMKEWRERGMLKDLLPYFDEQRWEQLMGVVRDPSSFDRDHVNRLIGLFPVLQDARNLDMQDGSIDFICSNNTLEHIPANPLRAILKEFGRVLKPGGCMSHFIDMSDHFAHFDRQITIYNFLTFSRRQWKLLDNRIQPQNRLRFRDYLEIWRETGLPVTHQEVREGDPEALESIRVHPEFSGYSRKELAISHATIITQKQRTDNMV